ncbi:HdeD family acid-resistance protein [Oscillatoria sp. FACHB-1407]|uniref:HdeD family acid-resistance protein n=1 Tax=Oscillatoria sp. FACHB-1407 TaxID=2692847 RepID=UPI001689E652|nr:HdeD family acid-resistance protein [Oscillatoria sp. FACHB-1407]MBD2460237.1 HdeD family acid-resistance protein [Oscillatoria sp. FACHB-1407]
MTSNVNNDTPNLPNPSQQKANNSLLIGALLVVLGLVAIALPAFSTIVAETWIALILVSAGTGKLVYAFQTREQGGFIWKLLLSILYIATGLMLFFNPLTGVLTITLLLGTFLLTEGTFELILAFRLRPQQNWTWALANAIGTLLLGALIWFQWPSNAPWLLGTLVGVSVLFTGISRIMLSLSGRPAINAGDQVPTT